jgi:hypothetical protein
VEITGIQDAKESSFNLQQIINKVPENISLSHPNLDLVIVIDTMADPDTLKERCVFAKQTLDHLYTVLAQPDLLRVSIIGYGDHELVFGFQNPNRPEIEQVILWDPREMTERFLDKLRPTPLDESDFESGLDEALDTINKLSWRDQARRAILTIGNRPPHPHTPEHLYQLGSIKRLDWKTIIHTIQTQIKAESLVIICPLLWPGSNKPTYAEEYADQFWEALGYTACVQFDYAEAEDIANRLANQPTDNTLPLRLPVIFPRN